MWESGDDFKGTYILLGGEVTEIRDAGKNSFEFKHSASSGTIIGASHTITKESICYTKAKAMSTVYVAFISDDII